MMWPDLMTMNLVASKGAITSTPFDLWNSCIHGFCIIHNEIKGGNIPILNVANVAARRLQFGVKSLSSMITDDKDPIQTCLECGTTVPAVRLAQRPYHSPPMVVFFPATVRNNMRGP